MAMDTPEELRLRLDFLGFSAADQARLQALRPTIEQHLPNLVAAFYRHLLSFDATRDFLRDPAVKERLVELQRDYLLSLTAGTIDQSYLEARQRIGETHLRLGLEPRWFLGGSTLHFNLLAPLVFETARGDSILAERTLGSLAKILALDTQLVVEAYLERREHHLAYLNRELSEAGRNLAQDYQEQGSVLRQTTHRAQTAEQLASIATLVAGLAHEIGTPMGVIRGHAELLESAVEDERSRWRAGAIREQVDRISKIIESLLNMARPREPIRVPLELGKLTTDALGFLREKFRRSGIKIEKDFSEEVQIWGEPDRVQQLCLNLFLNAVDAMPEGGTLTVRLKADRDQAMHLIVSDTGAGIPAENLDQIFDPFFTTKAAGVGNGLGLVVARGIVLDLHGSIDVRSQIGRGSEFEVRLPQGNAQSDAPSNSGM